MRQEQTRQLILDLGHRAALAREDFLVSDANRDAVGWIDRWPAWPAPCLILQGPAASGKTHLAAVWREKTQAVSVSSESLADGNATEIARLGRNLVIDAADLWIGDRETETTLFHLYNIMMEEGRSFLMTMRLAPARAEFALPDLASRLRAAPAAVIQPPDDALLAAVIVKLFADRQIAPGEDVLKYILPRMERSFAAARDLVARTDALALATKKPVSVALARRVLLGGAG